MLKDEAFAQISTLVYSIIAIAFVSMILGRVVLVKYLKFKGLKRENIKLLADVTTLTLFTAGFFGLWLIFGW